MIRITTQKEQDYTIVMIDGQASAEDVTEIQQIRSSLAGDVVLNLSGLSSCSDEGIRILYDWLKSGARLRNATLYLRMVLENPPNLKR